MAKTQSSLTLQQTTLRAKTRPTCRSSFMATIQSSLTLQQTSLRAKARPTCRSSFMASTQSSNPTANHFTR
ncbi:hypothetical protein B0W48_08070 [Pseudoalteromonas aliena]|uniref:Uncharacterized protein n=1 Tax=Pseudoalteromonas aliena TaxID=247523 RepID=A0A1Q2GXA9_9GAMM|nr:hypothetical protein [Pseudoalteromonas aliena]AQP99753.1 hypothetical protein B0W48_08070 [Pseudoalteromonas aliena]